MPLTATRTTPGLGVARLDAEMRMRDRSAALAGDALLQHARHLAGHDADRHRLAAEPELLPTAMEELLRAYAPVTMARLVKEDMTWHGVDMKADDWVLLPFPAANRDPEQFERADEVVIDRTVNRHAAFGLGIHRCVGSHLARMELRVALDVWLRRIPEFTLADPAAVRWSSGQIRGPRELPLRIG